MSRQKRRWPVNANFPLFVACALFVDQHSQRELGEGLTDFHIACHHSAQIN